MPPFKYKSHATSISLCQRMVEVLSQRATQGRLEIMRERPVAVPQGGQPCLRTWPRRGLCAQECHVTFGDFLLLLVAVPGAGTWLVDVKPLLFFLKKILFNLLAFLFFVCLFCPEPNCLTNCPLGTLALPASRRKCFRPSSQTVWRGHWCNSGLAPDTQKQVEASQVELLRRGSRPTGSGSVCRDRLMACTIPFAEG